MLLADMGADVIMTEKPGSGDDARNGREHKSRKRWETEASATSCHPYLGHGGHEEDL